MTRVYISVGSNLGDRFFYLSKARQLMLQQPGVRLVRVSPCFETEPEDTPEPQPLFLNSVWELDTDLTPQELRSLLQGLETRLGRERPYPNAPRTLDLDILIFGDLTIQEENLTIPHPRLRDRLFVLKPLAVLAPKWKDPETGAAVDRLLEVLLEGHSKS